MKKLTLILLLILLALVLGAGFAQHDITLALDWTPNTNHTGIYVALEQGWYEEAGVNLTILPYGSVSPDALVANGQADVGISGAESVYAAAAIGEPVVSIAAIMASNTAAFAVRADSDIQSPKDFAGKLYAAFGAAYERPILEALIAADGGEGTVEEVFLDVYGFDAILSGRADVVWIFEGWQGIQAEREGIEVRLFNFTKGGLPDYYTPVIVASPEGLDNNAEALRAFIQATARGYHFAINNPDYAVQMLLAGTEAGTFPDADFLYNSQLYVSQYYKSESQPWGIQSEAMWAEYGQFLVSQGVFQDADGNVVTSLPFDQLYTNALLTNQTTTTNQAATALGKAQPTPSTATTPATDTTAPEDEEDLSSEPY